MIYIGYLKSQLKNGEIWPDMILGVLDVTGYYYKLCFRLKRYEILF